MMIHELCIINHAIITLLVCEEEVSNWLIVKKDAFRNGFSHLRSRMAESAFSFSESM